MLNDLTLRSIAPLVGLVAMICCTAVVGSADVPTGKDLTFVRDGRAQAVMLVAPDAPPPVAHAANELQHFIERITGVKLARVNQPAADQINLAVGPEAARMLDPSFNAQGLKPDGIALQAVGARGVILAGPPPRGTLYAVYTLLEDHFGCRWWAPDASTIPQSKTLTVPVDLHVYYNPPLEYRFPFWTEAFDPDWSVRNKANGSTRLDEKRGGYTDHGGVHTFYRYIPPDRYFEQHPEWFSQINGKRKHQHAQLCLTNEAMRNELIKNLKDYIRKHPNPPIYSVSQNDWHGYCTCDNCNTIAEKHGGQSGIMLWFVNQVAEAVEKDFPNATISTLAYQYTRNPPKNIRPRDNVVIQLCTIECSFAVPLTHERNAAFRDDIIGWSKVADRLYIWDYTTNFRHYFMPHPNLRVLGPNVRFFVDHGAAGIFEQGAYTTRGAAFTELRSWVLAKLLWNPKLDDKQLIETFCAGYYGPAAEHVLAYIDVIHDAAAEHGEYAHCLPGYNHRFDYLTFEVMNKAWKLMRQAEQAVRDQPAFAKRVQRAKLPVMYAYLWRWPELRRQAAAQNKPWPLDDDPAQVGERFKQIAKDHGVTRVNEWYDGFDLVDRAVKRAEQP